MRPGPGRDAGAPEPGRVAQVVVIRSDGRRVLGSGYRVTSEAVLTAAHVVDGAASVTVRFDAAEPTAEATGWNVVPNEVRTGPTGDVAVLVLPPEAASGPVEPVRFGRVGDRAAVVECVTIGFPRFKLKPSDHDGEAGGHRGWYRDRVQAVGRIPVLSNPREGTLEIITDPPEPDPEHSPWEGMSGAAVWAGGRIVGVVSRHHRTDSPGRLAGARFDHWREALPPEQRASVDESLGLGPAPLPDVVPPETGETFALGYLAQVRDTAPDELIGRDDELAELVGFCAGDEPYAWWQAGPWAGKSALAAWFVLHPPAGVTVASFFITSRLAGQSDSAAFTDTLCEQLAAIVGEAAPSVATPAGRDRERRRLVDLAAAQAAERGRRLLLVVDGLDEDTGAGPGGRLPSIASLLPRRPPDALRVLVTSRPHPGLPGDVPAGHPLRHCARRRLTPSAQARNVARAAQWELAKSLHGDDRIRDVLCYLTACGGGLTRRELSYLVGAPGWELDGLFGTVFGRTLYTRKRSDSERVYLFGHESLRRSAEEHLAGDLGPYRARVHEWAEDFRRRGWPPDTPRYLLRPYGAMLAVTGETDRLATLAADPARHDRMLDRQHNDADALAEIRSAQQALLDRPPADLAALGAIAVAEWRLKNRNTSIPIDLPAVWARLGDPHRAERSARAITDPYHRAEALTQVAVAVAGTDPDRAVRVARVVGDPYHQTGALTRVAVALAGTDPGRARQLAADAERVARSITDTDRRARALTQVAAAMAGTDPGRPGRVVRAADAADAAERVARTMVGGYQPPTTPADLTVVATGLDVQAAERTARAITDPGRRARALTEAAAAVAGVDPDRARAMAEAAERVARTVSNPYQRAEALAQMAVALAVTGVDPDRAVRVVGAVGTVSDPYHEARALAGVAGAVAGSDPDRARRFAEAAERVARTVTDPDRRARALTDVVGAVAGADPDRAERLARTITDPYQQARALGRVVRALVHSDPDRAECLSWAITDSGRRAQTLCRFAVAVASADQVRAAGAASAAERIVGTIAGSRRSRMLINVAGAVAATDPDRGEDIARTITEPDRRARALHEVAATVANSDPDRAERVARTITSPYHRARALTRVAVAVARTDPDRAEHITGTLADPDRRARAVRKVVAALAGSDPDRAERLARTSTDADTRARALNRIAAAVADADPDRARRLVAEVIMDGDWLDAVVVLARVDPPAVHAITDHVLDILAPDPERDSTPDPTPDRS